MTTSEKLKFPDLSFKKVTKMEKLFFLTLLMFASPTLVSCQNTKEKDCNPGDAKPQIKIEEITHYDLFGSKKERDYKFGEDINREYDTKGNLISESWVVNDNETAIVTYLYHYQNNTLKKLEHFSAIQGGKKNEEIEYEYDKNNQLIKEIHKRIKENKEILDKTCFYVEYSYAKNKEVQNIYRYDENAKSFAFSYRQENYFDGNNNKIKALYFDENNKIYQTEKLEYNSKNQLIMEYKDNIYTYSTRFDYEYNENGDLVKETYNNDEKQIKHINYKYDCHKNWIEKTDSNKLTNRKIIYY